MNENNPVKPDDVRKHVTTSANNIVSTLRHRIEYGSPTMLNFGVGVMIASAYAPPQLRQDRIRRRRELIGLKYEHWDPPKGI